MSVDDFGLEVLKKAGVQLRSGDPSEYVLRTSPENKFLDIAKGKVPGHSISVIVGHDEDLGATEDVFGHVTGTVYPFPAAAGAVSFVSTSANDTAAGTGARQITIVGLDASYNLQTVVYATNGLTPVVTTETFIALHTITVTAAGSLQTNAGTITASIGGSAQLIIAIGDSVSQDLVYMVPDGHTLYMHETSMFTTSVRPMTVVIYTVKNGVRKRSFPFEVGAGDAQFESDLYFVIPERTGIYATGQLTSGSGEGFMFIGGILVQDSLA